MLYNANHALTQRKNIQQFSVGDSVPFILLMLFLTFRNRAKGARVCGPFPWLSFIAQSLKALGNLYRSLEHEDTAHWLLSAALCSRKVSNREPCALLYSPFSLHTMAWHETRNSTKGSPPVRSSSEFFVLCSIEELVN